MLRMKLKCARGTRSRNAAFTLVDPRAEKWWPAGHYTLARTYQETGQLEKAEQELTYQPSPQEAGNRLRLRYLRQD